MGGRSLLVRPWVMSPPVLPTEALVAVQARKEVEEVKPGMIWTKPRQMRALMPLTFKKALKYSSEEDYKARIRAEAVSRWRAVLAEAGRASSVEQKIQEEGRDEREAREVMESCLGSKAATTVRQPPRGAGGRLLRVVWGAEPLELRSLPYAARLSAKS